MWQLLEVAGCWGTGHSLRRGGPLAGLERPSRGEVWRDSEMRLEHRSLCGNSVASGPLLARLHAGHGLSGKTHRTLQSRTAKARML